MEHLVNKFNIFILLILIILGIVLYKNINYYPVPESDFFQFLSDSWSYKQFKLPKSIQSPPANPILIAIFGNLLHRPQAELLAAVGFNIIFYVISIFLVWQITKKHLGNYALILVLLFITNPLSYHVALNPSSESLFLLCVLLIFYVRQRNNLKLAYILSALTILVRYEAVALLGTQIISDLIFNKNKKYILKLTLAGIIIVSLWFLVVSKQNPNHQVSGNAFIQEITAQLVNLPNMEALNITPYFLFIRNQKAVVIQILSYLYFSFLLLGIIIIFKTKNKEVFLYYLFLLGYILFHLCFPSFNDRYDYPIIWAVYLGGLWPILYFIKKNKPRIIVGSVISVFILFYSYIAFTNAIMIRKVLSWRQYQKYQYVLLAEWLNNTKFPRDVLVITIEPWIATYYTNNKQVIYHRMGKSGVEDCNSLRCLIKNADIDLNNKDILFILENSMKNALDYLSITKGVLIFKNFEQSEESKMCSLLITLEKHEKWLKIYQCHL